VSSRRGATGQLLPEYFYAWIGLRLAQGYGRDRCAAEAPGRPGRGPAAGRPGRRCTATCSRPSFTVNRTDVIRSRVQQAIRPEAVALSLFGAGRGAGHAGAGGTRPGPDDQPVGTRYRGAADPGARPAPRPRWAAALPGLIRGPSAAWRWPWRGRGRGCHRWRRSVRCASLIRIAGSPPTGSSSGGGCGRVLPGPARAAGGAGGPVGPAAWKAGAGVGSSAVARAAAARRAAGRPRFVGTRKRVRARIRRAGRSGAFGTARLGRRASSR